MTALWKGDLSYSLRPIVDGYNGQDRDMPETFEKCKGSTYVSSWLCFDISFLIFLSRLEHAPTPSPTAAFSDLNGHWTGLTHASAAFDGGPLFKVYNLGTRCGMKYSLSPMTESAGSDACANRCIANPLCQFYSYVGSDSSDRVFQPVTERKKCFIFSSCAITEVAENYTTWQMRSPLELVSVSCKTELTISESVVDLAVHSCDDASSAASGSDEGDPSLGVRKSAQTGALRGIIRPPGPDAVSGVVECDALSAGAEPCLGLQYPKKGPPQFFNYWRFQILWTGSSRDRAPGDVDNVLIAFNLSDGAAFWPLQISMYRAADAAPNPVASFDLDLGMGRSQFASRLRLQPAVSPQVRTGTDVEDVQLLNSLNVCQTALRSILVLDDSNRDSACAAAAANIFSNQNINPQQTTRISQMTMVEKICETPCYTALLLAARGALSTCTSAWKASSFSTVTQGYADDNRPVVNASIPVFKLLLSSLLRLADGVYTIEVACATSWLGAPCSYIFPNVTGCARSEPSGRPYNAIALQTLFKSKIGEGCSRTCADGFADFIYTGGCCAGTISAAEEQWIQNLISPPIFQGGFWVDWGETRLFQLIRAPDDCADAAATSAVISASGASTKMTSPGCAAGLCGFQSAWPDACCTKQECKNGGFKVNECIAGAGIIFSILY
jgi:hypothetical protein